MTETLCYSQRPLYFPRAARGSCTHCEGPPTATKVKATVSLFKSNLNDLKIFLYSLPNINIYLAHVHSAYGECNVFTIFVLPSIHRGGGDLGKCTI